MQGILSRREFILAGVGSFFKPKVLINPGHNSEVVGSKHKGIGYEYKICTDISRLIASKLISAGIPTELTRDENKYRPEIMGYENKNWAILNRYIAKYRAEKDKELSDRELVHQLAIINYAKKFNALISIHLNGVPEKSRKFTRGFAVAYSSHNSHPLSRDLAIGIHSKLRESFSPSNNLAEQLVLKNRTVPGLMEKGYVLTGNGIALVTPPSVLVECGYIYEKYGLETIVSKNVQEKYANKISEGIREFTEILPYLN